MLNAALAWARAPGPLPASQCMAPCGSSAPRVSRHSVTCRAGKQRKQDTAERPAADFDASVETDSQTAEARQAPRPQHEAAVVRAPELAASQPLADVLGRQRSLGSFGGLVAAIIGASYLLGAGIRRYILPWPASAGPTASELMEHFGVELPPAPEPPAEPQPQAAAGRGAAETAAGAEAAGAAGAAAGAAAGGEQQAGESDRAAALPAQRLTACAKLFVLCSEAEGSGVEPLDSVLCLNFRVDGKQQPCLVACEAFDDAFALRRQLQAMGQDTRVVEQPTAGLLAYAAARAFRPCLAFYARGRLQAGLATLGSLYEGEEDEERVLGQLFGALEAHAALLGTPHVAQLAVQLAGWQTEAGGSQPAQREAEQGGAPQRRAGQPAAAAPQPAAAVRERQPSQERGPPAPAPAPERPAEEEASPRPRLAPGWWLALPVVHVPRLMYEDGAEGLLAVSIKTAASVAAAIRSAAAPGARSSSNGATNSSSPNGANGRSSGAEEGLERHVVAFVSQADAQALALLAMRSEQDVVQGQTVRVPPRQLAAHAAASGSQVSVLLPGEVAMAAGASYQDEVVPAVQEAVQNQYFQQLAAGIGEDEDE